MTIYSTEVISILLPDRDHPLTITHIFNQWGNGHGMVIVWSRSGYKIERSTVINATILKLK